MISLYMILLLGVVNSGKLCLNFGFTLEWNFHDSVVDFIFTADYDAINYLTFIELDFVIDPSPENYTLDINRVAIEQQRVYDKYRGPDGDFFDDEVGGSIDIFNQSYDPLTYQYRWTRPVRSADVDIGKDYFYQEGAPFKFHSQHGKSIVGGELILYVEVEDYEAVFDDNSYFCRNLFLQT